MFILTNWTQFVKHDLKSVHYLRYCDDFVLVSHQLEQLTTWRNKIERFLSDKLALTLNKKQRLAPVSNGIDFLGYIVRRDYLLVRNRVINHLNEKLNAYKKQLVVTQSGVCCYRYDEVLLDELHATLSSYLGHFKLANSWRLKQSLWSSYEYISNYFEWDKGKLLRKYKVPSGFSRVRQQYYWFRWRFPKDILLFRVGRFYEFYHSADCDTAKLLGLKHMRANRRGAKYGFPAVQREKYLSLLIAASKSVCVVGQVDVVTHELAQRKPCLRFSC